MTTGGTGEYYYKDPTITGLVSTEDMVAMMDEMGIDTGLDVDRLLAAGAMVKKYWAAGCVRKVSIPEGFPRS